MKWLKRYWYILLITLILVLATIFGRSNAFFTLYKKYRKRLNDLMEDLEHAENVRSKQEETIKNDYDTKIKELDEQVEATFQKAKAEDKLDALAEKLFGKK